MKLYKLTDRNNKTQAGKINETVWGPNVTHTASGSGTELCTDGVIHAYIDPRLAAILNPIHVNFDQLKLWEAEGEIVAHQGQLIVGVKSLTTIKEIPLPVITDEQKVKFAILCALEVYKEETFVSWANKWLSGEDRTTESADRMASPLAAEEPPREWIDPATELHARNAVFAAWAAARACSNAHSISPRSLAARSISAATQSATTENRASEPATAAESFAAAVGNKDIDLIAILDKAMK